MKRTLVTIAIFGAACGGAESTGKVTLDIRNLATVATSKRADGTTRVTLNVRRGDKEFNQGAFDVFDSSRALDFDVTAFDMNEAKRTLYTATTSVPAFKGSRCGDTSITLALSLIRREKDDRIGGALTAYCGDAAQGVPARIVRLSGTLPAKDL